MQDKSKSRSKGRERVGEFQWPLQAASLTCGVFMQSDGGVCVCVGGVHSLPL